MFDSLLLFESTLRGKRILVTGHTGFTGSWLCLWLKAIGAQAMGYALAPITKPSLYNELGLESQMLSKIDDIGDCAAFARCVEEWKPELIVHLAAQPLVRYSYREPIETFAVNTLGTAHVLEAARLSSSVTSVLCITTDKVYKNPDSPRAHKEEDALGGKDPYSASKAAAELIIDSYRASYSASKPLAIAVARGGNIIGGGDWAEDRLIPDFVRALQSHQKLTLRYPDATRPWQHVLGLVQGYLMLLAGLVKKPETFSTAWNFGPSDAERFTVRDVLGILSEHWAAPEIEYMEHPLHESHMLALDSSRAREQLGWVTPWDTRQVVIETADWYREFYAGKSAQDLCLGQINQWRDELRTMMRG
ncbi:MAG: CDP-glucose 4,6-dehydratase [Gammaproteobacteria bacterium]